jgi:hypothetical protein
MVMAAEIITVGVRELKNRLSEFLREVRRGSRILVTDRNRVVAELREPDLSRPAGQAAPYPAGVLAEGRIHSRRVTKPYFPEHSLRVPAGTVERLLKEEREER